MPRTALTVQTTARTGLVATYTAASVANGHEFINSSEKVVLHVKNAGGGATVITIKTPGTVDGLAIADKTVTVSAGTEAFIGPFDNDDYGQDGAGSGTGATDVYIDLDVDTSVTLAAIKLGSA